MENRKRDSNTDWGAINPGEVLTAIHEVSSDVIYLFDLETESNIYISKSIGTALGYSPEEIKKMGPNLLATILHPEDLARVAEDKKILEQLKDGEIYHSKSRFLKADGGILHLKSRQIVYSRDKKGKPKIILGVTHDITELQQHQEKLQEMAIIAQKTTNAIMITNPNEEILWVNKGYEDLTGYKFDEVVGKKPNIVVYPSEKNKKAIAEMRDAFADGRTFSNELVSRTKKGEEFWVRVIADPLFDEEGKLLRYIFIAQNITELKQNEVRLLQSYERLKKYAFFTSHQLRSPVADILSILDVYDYDNPLNKDNIRLLRDLKTVSQKLDDVVHELNDLLSIDNIQFEQEQQKMNNLQNIMLVDDDKVFINITSLILRRFNDALNIQSYTDPSLALKILQQEKANPDAIFLDINMPEIDGWKFLENLEEMGISSDVYMLTSSIDPADMEKSKTYTSVKGYFTKPLTKQVLADYFL